MATRLVKPNILTIIGMHAIGESQNRAGWIGFWSSAAGCVAGLLFSAVSDGLGGKKKLLLIVLNALAGGVFTWFSLVCADTLPRSSLSLYAGAIVGGFLNQGTIPLFYEMGCEVVFPIPEGLSMGVLTLLNNVACLIFLLLPVFGLVAGNWMNFAVRRPAPRAVRSPRLTPRELPTNRWLGAVALLLCSSSVLTKDTGVQSWTWLRPPSVESRLMGTARPRHDLNGARDHPFEHPGSRTTLAVVAKPAGSRNNTMTVEFFFAVSVINRFKNKMSLLSAKNFFNQLTTYSGILSF